MSHIYIIEADRVWCVAQCTEPGAHWKGHGPVEYTMVNGTKVWIVRIGKAET